jgi:hypothetical protein
MADASTVGLSVFVRQLQHEVILSEVRVPNDMLVVLQGLRSSMFPAFGPLASKAHPNSLPGSIHHSKGREVSYCLINKSHRRVALG